MNITICNNLSCYDSVDSFTSRLTDFGNFIISPIINTYSFLANLFCVIVFLSKKLKGETNQILLLISLTDFIGSIFRALIMPARCGLYCSIGYTYSMKFYELYIFLLQGNTRVTFIIFLYNYLAFIKLSSFSNKIKKDTGVNKLIVIFGLLISAIVNIPNDLLTRKISHFGNLIIRNSTYHIIDSIQLYRIESTIVKKSIIDQFLFVVNILKGFLMVMLLLAINMSAFVKLKIHIRKKIYRDRIQNQSTVLRFLI